MWFTAWKILVQLVTPIIMFSLRGLGEATCVAQNAGPAILDLLESCRITFMSCHASVQVFQRTKL
jgi:hypothetical protein